MDAIPTAFDAHLHPEGLTDADLESLHFFGIRAAVAVAHHSSDATRPGELRRHFDDLLERQIDRLERAGIRAYAAIGIHPLRIPRRGLEELLDALPNYFQGGRVIALGELGLHRGGDVEEECVRRQLEIAKSLKLRAIVHTPQRSKPELTRRSLKLLRESGVLPSSVLVDHANATTIRTILACGHYVGLTIHPDELRAEQAVRLIRSIGTSRLILDSDAGDGPSDLLGVPRTLSLLQKARLSSSVVARVARANAERFFNTERLGSLDSARSASEGKQA